MKKIFENLLLYIAGTVFCVLIVNYIIWFRISTTTKLQLPLNKQVIVFGSSMTKYSINDTILNSYKNCGRDACNVLMAKELYKAIIDSNYQIDTVLIEISINTFSHEEEKPGFNLPFYANFSDLNAYKRFGLFRDYDFHGIISSLVTIDDIFKPNYQCYGYRCLNRNNICNNQLWSKQWCDSALNDYQSIMRADYLASKDNSHILSILELVDYCKLKNKITIVYIPPSYHLNNWYDSSAFEECIQLLDDDILIADYSNFEFPNLTYYADVYHLNGKGASYLSSHINNNGLKIETKINYIQRVFKAN